MVEILSGQMLEIDNLFSYRGKIKSMELEEIGKKMEEKVNLAGAKRIGMPITVTYGVENDTMEILLPIDREISSTDEFCYKERIKIVNALVAKHKGNPMKLQNTCNELNQYIAENKLVPITAGYNVTKKTNPIDIEDTEIDVYVGINPNIWNYYLLSGIVYCILYILIIVKGQTNRNIRTQSWESKVKILS